MMIDLQQWFPLVFRQLHQGDGAYFIYIGIQKKTRGLVFIKRGGGLPHHRLSSESIRRFRFHAGTADVCKNKNKFRLYAERRKDYYAGCSWLVGCWEQNNSLRLLIQPKSTNGRIAWAHDNFRWLLVTPPPPLWLGLTESWWV